MATYQLPNEILMQVFGYLADSSLFSVVQVSQRFYLTARTYLYRAPQPLRKDAWHALELCLEYSTQLRTPLNPRQRDKLLDSAPWKHSEPTGELVSVLDFSMLYYIVTDDFLQRLTFHTPALTHLILCSPKSLNNDTLCAIGDNCPVLTHLVLVECTRISALAIQYIISQCPLLIKLNLHGTPKVNNQTVTTISHHLSRLKELNLSRSPYLTLYANQSDCNVIDSDNNTILQSPSSSLCFRLPDTIQRLTLSGVHELRDESLFSILPWLTQLEMLEVDNTSITDYGMQAIATHCPLTLTHLNIANCSHITDDGLKTVVRNWRNDNGLIVITQLYGNISQDAVNWCQLHAIKQIAIYQTDQPTD